MNNKILFYNRSSPHYRIGIYKLLEKKLNVDFYFGNKRPGGIKKIDYNLLNNFRYELKNFDIKKFYYQKGLFKIILQNYNYYITPGDYNSISNWLFLPIARLLNKKIIFWTHGMYGNESFFKRMLLRIFFSLSNEIMLYSNYNKQIMIKNGINPNKLHVIYNSLDYYNQIKIREKLLKDFVYKNDEEFRLIFIGRLTKVKKIHLLIKSLIDLNQDGINCKLTIIGSGIEEQSLIELVNINNIRHKIDFVGELYNEEEISKHLFNADLCVSPGNVGLTAMHSMMYGTPVISHNNFELQMPEFESIIPGVTGDFYDFEDPSSLTKVIKSWIINKKNKLIVKQNCFKVIDKFYNPNYQIQVINKIINKK